MRKKQDEVGAEDIIRFFLFILGHFLSDPFPFHPEGTVLKFHIS